MTYGSTQDGGATFHLTKAEHEALKAGQPVTKTTSDSKGVATITLQVTRPDTPERRFPFLDPAEARRADEEATRPHHSARIEVTPEKGHSDAATGSGDDAFKPSFPGHWPQV